MIGDPIGALQQAVCEYLKDQVKGATAVIDGVIGKDVPWRPHVLQGPQPVGWQVHSVLPDSQSWSKRIGRAREVKPGLRVGIAATENVWSNPDFLVECHALAATVLVVKERRDGFTFEHSYSSVPDFVCERRLKLDTNTARSLLDTALARSLAAKTNVAKGVQLELLVAMMLSQVDNFEVKNIGIANRTQQMDVLVHNRSVGGILGDSPLVLAEAKNWPTNPVTPTEYSAFMRKLTSRHKRAKLGFLVTTGRFTSGVALEARRDSQGEYQVVFIDGKNLPSIWRGPDSITHQIEQLVVDASVGE